MWHGEHSEWEYHPVVSVTADKVTPYRGGAARGGYGYGVACAGGRAVRMRCGSYHWTRRVAPSRAAFPIRWRRQTRLYVVA